MKVEVTLRRTTHMRIRIGRNGDIRVSAPYGCTRKDVERFVLEQQDWIKGALSRTEKRMQLRRDFYGRLPLQTQEQRDEALERLNKLVPPLVKKYSAVMGVKPALLSYRPTISRWGSCYPSTGNIQFSSYLLLLPQWCVEHVVVHELAHLIEPTHNKRFHALMDKYFPRWKEAKAETSRLCGSHL